MRRHHLIEEAKAELDVAYEEVKRAERSIMALESEYNDRLKSVDCGELNVTDLMAEKEKRQNDFHIDDLYILQKETIERFARVSSAFTILGGVDFDGVGVDLVRGLLFHKKEARARKREIDGAIREFAHNLRSFSLEDDSADYDSSVRESWAAIERLLNECAED
jgi:hypothetical protein